MSKIKSKVMEGLGSAWNFHINIDDKECGVSDVTFIKSQIHAAVKEFAEMADIGEVINYLEQFPKQEGFISWANEIKQALAAFGIEEEGK